MKKNYTSGRVLSKWFSLKAQWTKIYKTLQLAEENSIELLDRFRALSLRLGLKKGVVLAALAVFTTAGVQAQTFEEVTSGQLLSSFDVGFSSTAAFVDLDGDTDLDLVSGEKNGLFIYFQNNGGVFTEQTGVNNPLDGLDVGQYSIPVFVDLDGDTDLDLVSGEVYGTFKYFENNGGVFTEQTGVNNPFDGLDVGVISIPVFVDLDADTDLDLVSGDYYGTFKEYRNTSPILNIAKSNAAVETIQVYPNPTTSALHVESTGAFELTNILGEVVLTGELQDGIVDVSSLSSGQYIIKTESGVSPFIKE